MTEVEIPLEYMCVICYDLMKDPTILCDLSGKGGHSYCAVCLKEWVQQCKRNSRVVTDPNTNMSIYGEIQVTNYKLKDIIDEWNDSMVTKKNVSEFRTLEFEDGIYTGKLHDQRLRHGKGIMKYHNRCMYNGKWKMDLHHGKGFFVNMNGDKYMGKWVNGKKHGKFVETVLSSGIVYNSHYDMNILSGESVTKYLNGDRFKCTYVDDRIHGEGIFINAATGLTETSKWNKGYEVDGVILEETHDGICTYKVKHHDIYVLFTKVFTNGVRHISFKRNRLSHFEGLGMVIHNYKCIYGSFKNGMFYKRRKDAILYDNLYDLSDRDLSVSFMDLSHFKGIMIDYKPFYGKLYYDKHEEYRVWCGWAMDNKANGSGTLYYKNGHKWTGLMVNDRIEFTHGVLTDKDGVVISSPPVPPPPPPISPVVSEVDENDYTVVDDSPPSICCLIS